mmetsp:Transcript_110333/g.190774  ORF Transcript_110333/g.190774 Transcript_110333/m.190774 type:complete len:239 (-) Transcript_110333:522-1238(-)
MGHQLSRSRLSRTLSQCRPQRPPFPRRRKKLMPSACSSSSRRKPCDACAKSRLGWSLKTALPAQRLVCQQKQHHHLRQHHFQLWSRLQPSKCRRRLQQLQLRSWNLAQQHPSLLWQLNLQRQTKHLQQCRWHRKPCQQHSKPRRHQGQNHHHQWQWKSCRFSRSSQVSQLHSPLHQRMQRPSCQRFPLLLWTHGSRRRSLPLHQRMERPSCQQFPLLLWTHGSHRRSLPGIAQRQRRA